jgi:uncharacterized membrane protein
MTTLRLLPILLAFLIGCVTGLRSMTGPAVVCWGAHVGWLQLDLSPLSFLHNRISLIVFTLFAVGELIADKLPKIPNRTDVGPLAVRVIFGAGCGAALSATAESSLLIGAALGGIGALAGTFAGYFLRRRLTLQQRLPDLPIALLEDLVAVGGGLFIVSRF